jgi:hypothetical protein
MIKKLFLPVMALVVAMSLASIALADEATYTGYLVDKHCSTQDVAKHGVGCTVSDGCAKSGLGVYADGKFTPFDADGTAKAIAALKASKKSSGAKFKVVGTVTEGKMAVKSIEEIAD